MKSKRSKFRTLSWEIIIKRKYLIVMLRPSSADFFQTSNGGGVRPTDGETSIDFDFTNRERSRDTPAKTRPRDRDATDSGSVASGGNPAKCLDDSLEQSYEKVLDFTYDKGSKEELDVGVDIGMINYCIDECTSRGSDCLAVSLQNERGGRQR